MNKLYLWRVMRLLILFLLTGFLHVAASGTAQTVTLKAKGISFEEAIRSIRQQTDYEISVNIDHLKGTKPVTVMAENMPIAHFLELILKGQPLDAQLEEKNIVLFRKPESKSSIDEERRVAPMVLAFTEVRGRVVDSLGRPLAGASIRVLDVSGKRTSLQAKTDSEGNFLLRNVPEYGQLEITFVGYLKETIAAKSDMGSITLRAAASALEEVDVVMINTGYQQLKPNEMAGAAEVITKAQLMEQTGTTILERLEGMIGSLNFNNKVMPGNNGENPNSVLNMTIRGYSTINGTTDPLIILNNFPYTGDLDNIDPNDVESIVLLKDAAATAMWGIRAANGVIVITTSGAKFGQKARVSYRGTVTTRPKPDLNKVDVADGPEVYDFLAEAQGKTLGATLRKDQNITELQFIGWQYYKGHISEQEFNEKLDRLKAIRPREQWSNLLYRNGLSQSHSLNISGGSDNLAWTVSANRDDASSTLQAKSNRNNVRMNTAFKMNDQLRIELGIGYTQSYSKTGAPAYNSIKHGISYQSTLGLVNPDGTPYGWYTQHFNPIHMDTTAGGFFRDLKYYPLDDWKKQYTTTNLESYIKNARLVYTPLKGLDMALNVQSINQRSIANNQANEDSYYARYNVAYRADIDMKRGVVNYNMPKGGIHQIRNTYANSFNGRFDVNYRKEFQKSTIVFNGAFDISESVNESDGQFLVGYIETPRGFSYPSISPVVSTLRGGLVPINHTSFQFVIQPKEITQRNISTNASLSYIYDERYIINFNARRDGANILGVNVNERWKPNYSIAANWRVHNERFFDVWPISTLTTGVSFGYVGNVDVSKSSRVVARAIGYHATYTQLPRYWETLIPPNPELRWEKTAHTNIKLDIGFFNDRLQVFSNYFIKNVSDLYQNTTVDPLQSLPGNYVANAGNMQVKGYEISISGKVIQQPLSYDVTFSTARMKEKITYYPNGKTHAENLRGVLGSDGVSLATLPLLLANMPLYSIFSIEGEGGYVNANGEYVIKFDGKEYNDAFQLQNNGIVAGKQDYNGIKIHGTATPTFTGGMHHRFRYKGWFLLFSLQAELGHHFKYPADVIGDLTLTSQFENRWRKPGDEAFTNIPKYTLPIDPSFRNYSHFSGLNIYRGDVIRLNNVQLSYNIPTKTMRSLNLAVNAQNLGAIWTANKKGYDYRYLNHMTWGGQDKYYSFTLNIGL